jgi:MFS family permease
VHATNAKDELTLGLIGLTEAIPFIITSFFSGHVADKVNKKSIVLSGIFLLLLGAVLLYLNANSDILFLKHLGLVALFSIVFVFGIIRSFLSAAVNPFLSQLVPRVYYTHAANWNSTFWHTGAILGPVLAGVIYGLNGGRNASYCHLIEVFLFVLALLFILAIKNDGAPEKSDKKETVTDSIKLGLNFVFKNKMVLSAISLDLFAVLFGGAVAMIPAFKNMK